MPTLYQKLLDIKKDYYLEDKYNGFLSVIEPLEQINEVRNPLMQNINGLHLPEGFLLFQTSVQNAAIRRDSSENRSPVYIDYYRINATSLNTAMYYLMNNLPAVFGPHVFSVILRTAVDTVVTLRVNYDNSSTLEKSYELKANKWQRIFIQAVAPVYSWGFKVLAKATIDVAHWQMESGYEISTPIHGLMGEGYKWLEYPHRSKSIRSKNILNGGIIKPLHDYGITLTDITGLGSSEFDLNATDLINQYSRLFDSISPKDRTIQMNYHLYSRTLEQLTRYHAELAQIAIDTDSPKTFIFSNDCYVINGIEFTGVLTEGLNFELNTFHGEELGLEIEMLSPLFNKTENVFSQLNGTYSVINQGLYSINNGSIEELNNMPIYTEIDAVHSAKNGHIYVAFYNGSNSTVYSYDGNLWTAICHTSTDDHITALHQNGRYLYVASKTRSILTGDSPYTGTSGNGLTRVDLISRTVNNIGSVTITNGNDPGTPPTPHIKTFATDSIGNLYVGGHFAEISYNAVTTVAEKIARFFTSNSWSTVGGAIGGYSGAVESLYFDEDEQLLYLGGDFREITGLPFFGSSTTPYVFSAWSPVTNTHQNPRYDFPINIVDAVFTPGKINKVIKFEGRIYVGGYFNITVRDGVSSNTIMGIGVLNNNIGLDSSSNVTGQITNINGFGLGKASGNLATIYDMTVKNDKLIVVGDFDRIINTITGDYTNVHGAVVIQNNTINEYNVISQYGEENFTNIIDIIESSTFNNIDVIFGKKIFNTSNIILPYQNVINLPKLIMSNEIDIVISDSLNKLVKISNISTNSHIYVEYQLTTDETLIVRIIEGRLKVYSSLFGDVSYKVISASPGTFYLKSGINDIRLYFNSTLDTHAYIRYLPKSLDGTVLMHN